MAEGAGTAGSHASCDAVLGAIERSGVALIVLDVDGVVARWCAGAERLFGWSAAQVVGRPWVDVGLAGDPVRKRGALRVIRAVADGEPKAGEWVARRADGTTVRIHTVHEPLRDEVGSVVGVVSMSFDLSAREWFEQALLREALHDRLTGLPGRALVEQHLAAMLDRSDADAAVLYLDLDGFKEVNDCHGHAAGDVVLVEVADRIRRAVRSCDLVARVGGDEFVIVVALEGCAESALDVADRVDLALSVPVIVPGGTAADVAASIGTVIAEPGDDPACLLRKADAAMYERKRTRQRN